MEDLLEDPATMDGEELSFDQALLKLEELAACMEEDDTPLEDALEVYERAVGLFAHCRNRIAQVEQRLERLTEDLHGELSTMPLQPPSEAGDV